MDACVPEVIGVDAVGALVWAKMAQEENPRKNAATMEEVVFTTSLYQEANIVSIDFNYTYLVLFPHIFCQQINAHSVMRCLLVTISLAPLGQVTWLNMAGK